MKKIWISGAAILGASTAYAATTGANVVGMITQGVTVVTAPAVSASAAAVATIAGTAVQVAPAPVIEAVEGAITTGLKEGQGQLPALRTNVNTTSLLVPSWGTGEIPQSSAPDVVGAFRFICTPGQVLRDDPIVFQYQPGKSHLHQFFGNTGANGNSTYGSLRLKGESTCNNVMNRSAYWIPAMLNGKGKIVRPDYVSIYYKRLPASSPDCQRQGKVCVTLPRGIRYIFGYNMATGDNGGHFYFNCDGPTAKSGHYPDIVTAAANCPVGNRLGAIISGPDCWDGKSLNSADHRSHVAYGGYGNDGMYKCPKTHAYIVPTFTLGAWYTVDEDLDTSGRWDGTKPTWSLASDAMPGMPTQRPGSTFHADWMGAWDDDVMKMWVDNCINKMLNCSGGDLGNGKQLRMHPDFSWTAVPHTIDIPA